MLAEVEGGFSVYAATLPGVVSQGETEKEALENIVEAFEGVLASYQECGETIPWLATPRELEHGGLARWVDVHG